MQSTHILAVRVVLLVTVFVLAVTACTATATPAPGKPTSSAPDGREAGAAAQVDAGAPVTATLESAQSRSAIIMKTHCSRCHMPAALKEIRKTSSEWEASLKWMETMGVQLSDTEKEDLINDLAVVEKP